MSSRLKVILLTHLVLHHAESCAVQKVQKKNPCFYVKEGRTEEYGSNVTLHQANISDKSVCTEVIMNYKHITHIHHDAFKGLVNLCLVNLNNNRISALKAEMFEDLKALKTLYLSDNRIYSVGKGTFKHLSSLEELSLALNYINQLCKDSFFGLLSLRILYLNDNRLHKLEKRIFLGSKLVSIDLRNNQLEETNIFFHDHAIATRNPNGGDNMISDLKNLQDLNLYGNNITHINTHMLAMLTGLKNLFLSKNLICNIDGGAFRNLENLMFLRMSKNKLTSLCSGMFIGLTSLERLTLNGNEIYHIEENTFAEILSVQRTVKIDLRHNRLSELSWTVFANSSSSMRPNGVNVNNLELDIDMTGTNCKRSHCWFKHSEFKRFKLNAPADCIICAITEKLKKIKLSVDGNSQKQICEGKLTQMCPSKAKWCMYQDNKTCGSKCEKAGKRDGSLVIDGEVCPFQYFCKCICASCEQKCKTQGKTHIKRNMDKYGCSICNCQCDNSPNCWRKCNGHNFVLKNNTYGCPQCYCLCSPVNCDANCTEGSAIIKKDHTGCPACNGCKIKAPGSKNETLIYVILSSVLLIMLLFSVTICCIFFNRRHKKDKNFTPEVRLTFLETLTKNLDPDLAQQVKETWFDPKTLCVTQLLGNGQFGLIWSGTFEASLGRKYPAVIKVAKAEFRDAWTVQTRWNSKHELKPHFEKRPIQIKVDNKVIADLLTEAMIMKKFNHHNVLKLFGVSVYEGKPCIIMPLMTNGDLKKYLIRNKLNLSNQQLTAFALGVAKGMAHLAEKNFVHCDLAARNCLLDINLVIKVSDFGLSKNIEGTNYYKLENDGKPLPIRWMSIESLKLKKFMLESDVWSFGVVLWEIFSYGQLPYANIDNMDVINYLLEGYRLEKPLSCPENVFEIMQKCWSEEPSGRLGFEVMVDMINKIADKEGDYSEVKDEPAFT